MNILVSIISDDDQRPNVSGADWYFDEAGNLIVKISHLSDWKRETLLAIHEVVEAILCKSNGVTQESVDAFDAEYDQTHSSDCNAGDEENAPYVREHCFATAVERILCAEMGVNWKSYDDELVKTYPGPSKRT